MEGEGKGGEGSRVGRGGNVEFHHLLLSNLTTDAIYVLVKKSSDVNHTYFRVSQFVLCCINSTIYIAQVMKL